MIESATEALDTLWFDSVEFDEVSARKISLDSEEVPESGNLDLQLEMQFRHASDTLSFRLRATVVADVAEVAVVVAGHYQSEEEFEISPTAIEEFANKVAFMAMFPYVRESVSDLFNRIGLTVNLPIMRQDSYSFSFEDSSETPE